MFDNPVCGSFSCIYADICEFYQLVGFAACSGHPVINPDGECAHFLCESCSDTQCSVWLHVPDSDTAIH